MAAVKAFVTGLQTSRLSFERMRCDCLATGRHVPRRRSSLSAVNMGEFCVSASTMARWTAQVSAFYNAQKHAYLQHGSAGWFQWNIRVDASAPHAVVGSIRATFLKVASLWHGGRKLRLRLLFCMHCVSRSASLCFYGES